MLLRCIVQHRLVLGRAGTCVALHDRVDFELKTVHNDFLREFLLLGLLVVFKLFVSVAPRDKDRLEVVTRAERFWTLDGSVEV